MFSSGLFPGVWILYADVSEHSVCSIFIGKWVNNYLPTCLWRWNRQSVPKRRHIKFRHYLPTCLWRWNRQSVPKRRHIKSRRRGNYPEENIQNIKCVLIFCTAFESNIYHYEKSWAPISSLSEKKNFYFTFFPLQPNFDYILPYFSIIAFLDTIVSCWFLAKYLSCFPVPLSSRDFPLQLILLSRRWKQRGIPRSW